MKRQQRRSAREDLKKSALHYVAELKQLRSGGKQQEARDDSGDSDHGEEIIFGKVTGRKQDWNEMMKRVKIHVKDAKSAKKMDICVICMGNFTRSFATKLDRCGHIFHCGCIQGWWKSRHKKKLPTTCPVCRQRFCANNVL